jgi:hypothetical protein
MDTGLRRYDPVYGAFPCIPLPNSKSLDYPPPPLPSAKILDGLAGGAEEVTEGPAGLDRLFRVVAGFQGIAVSLGCPRTGRSAMQAAAALACHGRAAARAATAAGRCPASAAAKHAAHPRLFGHDGLQTIPGTGSPLAS